VRPLLPCPPPFPSLFYSKRMSYARLFLLLLLRFFPSPFFLREGSGMCANSARPSPFSVSPPLPIPFFFSVPSTRPAGRVMHRFYPPFSSRPAPLFPFFLGNEYQGSRKSTPLPWPAPFFFLPPCHRSRRRGKE